ncbi:glycosyl hydrolase family 16 [Pareuzebyella sediminis]|uniref:glycosyl hydrolase family 16 n=1 Tax=Pareuzebyella sediminis TaxID=2607998 RepID=UPI001E522654|nr:glycosyl hydrolase family 16 [Pareuzebyella sediminis]
MKKEFFLNSKYPILLSLIVAVALSCERELSEEVEFATFPNNPEIFIDGFSGGLQYFPFAGSKFDAFDVDTEVKYSGTSSMRLDVPNFGDPGGAYAGAIFPDQTGRNLTGFDALTFWAKASQAGTINEIGLGNDFGENKYLVTKSNLRISTAWTKYIIPIPNPEKLTLEKGLFWYAEGPENENGYTIWIDELKYEQLGTIAQPRPAILNGKDEVRQGFLNDQTALSGLTQTFNMASGLNETVSAAPAYFDFNSSDVNVAQVSESGLVYILGTGTAKITASLGGILANGSLTLNVSGSFDFAPTPSRAESDVISIFSDAYDNVPVDFYNGFWEPFQTTESDDFSIDGDHILNYTNFNFVGNQFSNPTVDATSKPNFHVDIFIPGTIDPAVNLLITLKDFGADGADGGGDDEIQQIFFVSSDFVQGTWNSFDISITLTNKNRIGQIIYENINGSPLSNFYVDNIYFFNE